MNDDMGEAKFVSEDGKIAQKAGGKVSVNIVSKDSPPTYPQNADIILAWCYSYLYNHETDQKCFYFGKALKLLLPEVF